ncbi:MAG: methyltransferase domain-containing protein [Tannerellaceae bacterium]|jgi:ubiquinone/menaquinone biosynthesis C-methylase UbiE/prolyl-tRNA editing enzyme YbaK/EbsC (Cys-tRNA(Pro) deacylase)|nr:methyltransferase domain-containing protein [Tannerellaceae bacterium]
MQNDWNLKKQEHRQLSAATAEHYDELYAKSNFATGSYMQFELDTIEKYINQLPSNSLAIDIGSGTGRDSLFLRKYFRQVYGFDMSQEMVNVANKRKIEKRAGNVSFEVLDIEERELPFAANSVPFVNTAFGMGSFVQDLAAFFKEVKRVLQSGGIAITSFYNKEALVNKIELQWTPALAARVVEGEDCLSVNFEGKKYKIPAKSYSIAEIKKKITDTFERESLIEILTYPTLSALFPQDLFAVEKTRTLCDEVDRLLSRNLEIAAGPYIIAICRKKGKLQDKKLPKGYINILNLLDLHKVDIESTKKLKTHKPVVKMEDVRAVINAESKTMIKSIAVQIDDDQYRDMILIIGITDNCMLDYGKLSKFLGVKRRNINPANPAIIETQTGFQAGSIPLFGLPTNIPVILDNQIEKLTEIWCGTGKAVESIRLKIEELKKLSTPTFADVSKVKDS